ncbi:MAG: helix-turn-helix domain-containing protein [Emergencia sp.]
MKNFVIPTLDSPNGEKLSEYLSSSLEAFSDITQIPVTYFNDSNQIVREFKKEDKICNIFTVYLDCESHCRKNLSSAGRFASRLGEPYIFLCKAGLANIAVPLIIDEVFAGYFIAGPIVMGELRNSTINNFSALNDLNDVTLSMAKMFAGKMKVYQPNQISQIALLFYNCIITSVSGNNAYSALRNQYSEQNQINMDIQNYKREHASMEYPYDLEKVLIDNVIDGQVPQAKENVRKLINAFSILEAGDLEGIKTKALWLFAIIIRIASENDSNLNQTIDTDLDVINRITETETAGELAAVSESLIELITKNMLSSIYNGRSQIVTRALQFINKNYREKISLKDIEVNLHVNSSYFSTLFKQEMGVTFTDYLNSLKIDHACHLLTETNLSIIDISLSTGFEDQSYFTKVFKKAKGMTPKAYRSAHAAHAAREEE